VALLASIETSHKEQNTAMAADNADAAILAHVIKIAIERALTEEAASFPMEAERQKIYEHNTQTRVELATREAQRMAPNKEFSVLRVEVLAHQRREAPSRLE
jgi:hypothetical protein